MPDNFCGSQAFTALTLPLPRQEGSLRKESAVSKVYRWRCTLADYADNANLDGIINHSQISYHGGPTVIP